MADFPACIHRLHEGNIHEYFFTEISRHAVDQMFDIIESILIEAAANNPADQSNPTLINSSIGLQPLNHVFQRMPPIVKKYPAVQRAHIAIIVPPSPLLGTISKILRTVTPIHFYKLHEYERALAWLRSVSVSQD